jgi:uncharacterized protein DUF2735
MISFSAVALLWGTDNIEFDHQPRTSRRSSASHDPPREVLQRSTKERKKMSANLNQGSAQIYQFPAGGRAALGGRRPIKDKAAVDLTASPVAEAADCSESWYHQAAIQEAKPKWEH